VTPHARPRWRVLLDAAVEVVRNAVVLVFVLGAWMILLYALAPDVPGLPR
jgi:hypothetical protein